MTTLSKPMSEPLSSQSSRRLYADLLRLAGPVWVEQVLHMLVGLNDTYLANHLPRDAASAGAAVGTITYFLWFFGLLVGSVGTGATAIISRARGARHQSLANSVTGQSVAAAVLIGAGIGAFLFIAGRQVIWVTQLQGTANTFALSYLHMLSATLPFTMLMFIAGSCQRGACDTLTPAVTMVAVDIINMLASFALCRGWFGLPALGFDGIAAGTIIAYVFGGVMQAVLLLRRRGAAKLYLHRLRPHLVTLRRLIRIGLPAVVEGVLAWLANFGVIAVINRADSLNIMSAAHMNTVRLENISFLTGLAFSTAAATLVGTALGRRDPRTAARSAYAAFIVGGGIMTFCGVLMITLGRFPARWLSPDNSQIIHLTTTCLFITGFIQSGFAASLIFGGALRGAGDTLAVMLINLATIIGLRFTGVVLVVLVFHQGLAAVWMVLCVELFIRGSLIYLRFAQGRWKHLEV